MPAIAATTYFKAIGATPTLPEVLRDLEQRFGLKRVVFVGDLAPNCRHRHY
jgi:hypothetical protein